MLILDVFARVLLMNCCVNGEGIEGILIIISVCFRRFLMEQFFVVVFEGYKLFVLNVNLIKTLILQMSFSIFFFAKFFSCIFSSSLTTKGFFISLSILPLPLTQLISFTGDFHQLLHQWKPKNPFVHLFAPLKRCFMVNGDQFHLMLDCVYLLCQFNFNNICSRVDGNLSETEFIWSFCWLESQVA